MTIPILNITAWYLQTKFGVLLSAGKQTETFKQELSMKTLFCFCKFGTSTTSTIYI